MAIEFIWAIERQVRLGMRISSEGIRKLTLNIGVVTTTPTHRHVGSLVDLSREEWVRAIRKERIRQQDPLTNHTMRIIGRDLGRFLDLLVHVYHRGQWWQLSVWNPLLDSRIPLREHEPRRHNVVYFSHLKMFR